MAWLDDLIENYGNEGRNYTEPESFDADSDILVDGDRYSPPTVSYQPASGEGLWDRAQDLLGSVGDIARTVTTTARDIGTAVGTVQRIGDEAPVVYREARTNARSGNTIGQWWQYASVGEKVMVGLAAAGVLIAIVAAVRK